MKDLGIPSEDVIKAFNDWKEIKIKSGVNDYMKDLDEFYEYVNFLIKLKNS